MCSSFLIFLIFRQIFEGVNRIGPAGRDASSAFQAALSIDISPGWSFELGFVPVWGWMQSVGQTSTQEGILDAEICDSIGDDQSISRMK
jgi:hypothetical protein